MFQATRKHRQCSASRVSDIATNRRRRAKRFGLESLEARLVMTGTWAPVANLATQLDTLGKLALLTDGSVLAPKVGNGGTTTTEKLTPDSNGSYVNGTWTALAPLTVARSHASELMLPDARVLVIAGVTNPNSGEIYNPLTNVWSSIAPLPESFYDAPAMLLPNGKLLVGSISSPQTYIYDPATDTWSSGPGKIYGDSSDHESWTELPGGGILSYDVNANPGEAQQLDVSSSDPTQWHWVDAGAVPVPLEAGISAFEGMGPGVLMPDGRVLQLGRSSQTAIYTPSTVPGSVGTWAAGPIIPNGLEAGGSNQYAGSSAAMLPNGHVLFAVDQPDSGGPTRFYEFDPTAPLATSLSDVTPPLTQFQSLSEAYQTSLLVLPSGQVMLGINNGSVGGLGNQAFIYTPDGAPQDSWRPTITSVVANGSHYTLTGTQLNGISAGASHGANNFGATNYPIVELKNAAGTVYFARTSNWSSTGVATGSTPVTTDFSLPAGLPLGTYSLTVIANGIAANPVSFTGGVTGADLAVANVAPSGSYNEGDYVPYSFMVTNNGPSTATKAVLTDTLGANLVFNSAFESQGSYKRSGSVVTFSLGTIAVGQSATVTVWVQATEDGNLSNTAVASSNVSDPNSLNNTVVNTVAVAEPPIVVSGPITVSGKNQSNIQVATFTHANGVEPASDFVATINWGDGTTSTGSITESGTTYKVKGSHTYATNGSHTVTTTVVEASGGGSMSAMIAAVGPVQTVSTGGTPAVKSAPPAQTAASVQPSLQSAAVDRAISTTKNSRSRRLLGSGPATANSDLLDELFAALI
jgi:uncharacterized repeat protein (TIGR01451 family)